MKSKSNLLIIVTILIFLNPAYLKKKQQTQLEGNIEEVQRNRIIKNSNKPLYGEIAFELEEDLSIGNEDDENYAFYDSAMAIPDSNGNIFVMDYGNHRIQKYDKDGNYLLSFGRKGQGPGEFQGYGIDFWIDASNHVYVKDIGRLHRFNNNGEFKNTITFAWSEIQLDYPFRMTSKGYVLGRSMSWGEMEMDGPRRSNRSIILINSKGRLIKTVVTYRLVKGTPLQVMKKIWRAPSSEHTSQLYFCPLDGELSVYGFGSEYKLTVIDSTGEIVRVIENLRVAQPLIKKDKDRVLDWFMERQKNNIRWKNKFSRGEVESAMKFPKYKPFFNGIICDDKGRIYVKRFTTRFDFQKNKKNLYDVYNKNGYYLYNVVIPIRLPLIRNGCIYTTEFEEETGYARIKRYKIKNWDKIKEGI